MAFQGENTLKGLTVCHFGHYPPGYSRNRIIYKALCRAGARVVRVRNRRSFLFRTPPLFSDAMRSRFDLMLIGFPGHMDVPIGKFITFLKQRPLILDAFASLYDSQVFDRQLTNHTTLRAKRYFITDKFACSLSDLVLLDTDAHIRYFVDTFRVPAPKFRRLPVGADDEVMYPRQNIKQHATFTVLFYGSFLPLHGVQYIIDAAKILHARRESVQFIIGGSGMTYHQAKGAADAAGIKNVRFLGAMPPYKELPRLMLESHLCLGVFGTTPKTDRVIPNKVYEALAVARPVITGDTSAIRESLTHGKNVWLCPTGDGEALADAILKLKGDQDLRDHIGKSGYEHFRKHFSIDSISKQLSTFVWELLNRRKTT